MRVDDLRRQLKDLADTVPPPRENPLVGVHRRAGRRGRQVRFVTGAVLVATLASAAVVWDSTRTDGRRVMTGPPAAQNGRPSGSPADLQASQWSELPTAPIVTRHGVSATWTGSEYLVWGGSSGPNGATLHGDGAAYDPANRRWRPVSASPLGPRVQHSSVWTGDEWLIWGGYDSASTNRLHVSASGAAYDPTKDRWRMLPPSPLAPRAGTAAVWTGKEAIFIGGYPAVRSAEVRSLADAAAFDPAKDRWRALPPIPTNPAHALESFVPVWADGQVLVWASFTRIPGSADGSDQAGYDVFSYDPTHDRWRQVPFTGRPETGVGAAYWTGSAVLLPASPAPRPTESRGPSPSGLRGHLYDPTTNRYTAVAHGPVDDTYGPTVLAGDLLVRLSTSQDGAVMPGGGAVWDPRTDEWTALARAPRLLGDTPAVWTGSELLLWGGVYVDTQGPSPGGTGLRLGP